MRASGLRVVGRPTATDLEFLLSRNAVTCRCGHPHAEHSLHGPCHGCAGCDREDVERSDDHFYSRCDCVEFETPDVLTSEGGDVLIW